MASPASGGAQAPQTTRSRVLRCVAITFLVLIVAIATVVLIIWLTIRPKQLTFTIEDGSIRLFNLTNNTLNAAFDFSLRVHNPNNRISINYKPINLSVWFDDHMIASRVVPPFFQPHYNTTRLDVEAQAQSMTLLGSVAKHLRHHRLSRGVEVEVSLKARIRYKVGSWKSRKYHLRVYCSPVVIYSNSSSKFDRTYCDVAV